MFLFFPFYIFFLLIIYLQRGCGWQLPIKDKNSVNKVTNPMAKNANSVISTFTSIDSLTTIVNVSVILKRKSNFSTLLRSEKNWNALAGKAIETRKTQLLGKRFRSPEMHYFSTNSLSLLSLASNPLQIDTRGDNCQRDLRYPGPMALVPQESIRSENCWETPLFLFVWLFFLVFFFPRAKGEISKTCAHCPRAACEQK